MNDISILVPARGKPPAQETVETLCSVAASLGGELVLLYLEKVKSDNDDYIDTVDLFDSVADEIDVPFSYIIRTDKSEQTISQVAFQEEVSLIVLGAYPIDKEDEDRMTNLVEAVDVPVVVIPQVYLAGESTTS